MKNKKNNRKPSGLSNKQLIEKYETGENVNFNKNLKKISKAADAASLAKQKNKNENSSKITRTQDGGYCLQN